MMQTDQQKLPPLPVVFQPPPPTVVVIQQQCADTCDYTIRKAKPPGVILILVAIANLAVYIAIGMKFHQWYHSIYTSSFGNYLILGALACAGAKQNNKGIVIAAHVWCAFCYVQAVVQIALTLNDLTGTGLFLLKYFNYPDVLAIDAIFAIGGVIALICSIYIQVVCGKVTCCRQPQQANQQQVSMVTQQVYPAPQGQQMAGYVQQPPQYGVQQGGYTTQTNYGFSDPSAPPSYNSQ